MDLKMDIKVLNKALYGYYNGLKCLIKTVTARIFLIMLDRRTVAVMDALRSIC